MNKKVVLSIVLFISTFSLSAKEEPKYTSSTITKACKEAGHANCKEKATQKKEFIYVFKKAHKTYKSLKAKERFEKCFDIAVRSRLK